MSSLSHRHLIYSYTVTWVIHLAYLAYVGLKWKASKKSADQ
ncbi:hypothetical protein [Silvibacterium acidisoli]